MSLANFQKPYSTAEAERGKFVVLDDANMQTTYNYPSGSRGKYAMLVKDIDTPGRSATSVSAFGEPIAVSMTPVIQLDGIYGLPNSRFEKFTSGTGFVSANDLMEVSTGIGAYGYGVLRSRRTVRYRPGQGALARFTAKFSEGTSGYIQRAGFFSQEQAIQVGYQDENFGIIKQSGGKAQIMELNLISAAAGNENVSIVLDGTLYSVSATNVGLSGNVAEIGNQEYSGWTVNHYDNSVYFLSQSLGLKTGSFSLSSNGSLSGTFHVQTSGVADSVTFIPQSAFNLDKLDGTGTSGMVLNPQTLNVYQINFRWLGAGEIRFAIEDPCSGDMFFFHHIHWANRYDIPHIANPSMKVGYVAASLGGTGTDISVGGASILGGIEGSIISNYFPIAVTHTRSDTMNVANAVYHVLSVKNNIIVNDSVKKINLREILPQSLAASMSTSSSAPATIYLYLDATTSSVLTFEVVGECTSYSRTPTIITGGTVIGVYAVGGASDINIDLTALRLVIPPNSNLSVGVSCGNNITRAAIGLMYIED